jgi:hypothetical protein
MWIKKLARKTATADRTIGSHSDVSETIDNLLVSKARAVHTGFTPAGRSFRDRSAKTTASSRPRPSASIVKKRTFQQRREDTVHVAV